VRSELNTITLRHGVPPYRSPQAVSLTAGRGPSTTLGVDFR
jgi:hypothetical protein